MTGTTPAAFQRHAKGTEGLSRFRPSTHSVATIPPQKTRPEPGFCIQRGCRSAAARAARAAGPRLPPPPRLPPDHRGHGYHRATVVATAGPPERAPCAGFGLPYGPGVAWSDGKLGVARMTVRCLLPWPCEPTGRTTLAACAATALAATGACARPFGLPYGRPWPPAPGPRAPGPRAPGRRCDGRSGRCSRHPARTRCGTRPDCLPAANDHSSGRAAWNGFCDCLAAASPLTVRPPLKPPPLPPRPRPRSSRTLSKRRSSRPSSAVLWPLT